MSSQVVPISRPAVAASVTFADMERLAESVAKSGLFGMKTKEQALSLMAIAQAEGRHPALAARDYDIIQGRSAKKAEAMLRDFLESGGKVEWHELADTRADATFSHPAGGSVRITWDMERVKAAGLLGKEMYKKYPRQMLRSRVVSEGVRTVCPAATSGMYVPEEVADFEPRQPVDVTPKAPAAAPLPAPKPATPPHDPETGEVKPHLIPVPVAADGERSDWLTWGRSMIAALKSAKTLEEGNAWVELNNTPLANCAEYAPKAYGSIVKAIDLMRGRFADAPAQDGEIIEPSDATTILVP